MDRTVKFLVGALGQDAEPFHIGATLSWRWDSLHTARTATTEEDLLTELLGRESGSHIGGSRTRGRGGYGVVVVATISSNAIAGARAMSPVRVARRSSMTP
jgi:hypothetical protein